MILWLQIKKSLFALMSDFHHPAVAVNKTYSIYLFHNQFILSFLGGSPS